MTRKNSGSWEVVTFDRSTFLTEVWDYAPGDMVTILAPTGAGKTYFAYQLLEHTADADLPATVLVMKPRDSTVSRFSRRMRLRTVRDWPPSRIRTMVQRPTGWVLWPTESDDPDRDDLRHKLIFRRCLRERYRTAGRTGHPNIVFADETYSLEHEMSLGADLVRIWTKGRSVGCGLWAASQRPVWISRWALQAHHLFLAHDPDVAMQKRYGEIGGGVDPAAVQATAALLQRYQFLYINRDERTMCIVDAE